jgi:tRNA A-37 threonylcarbamoyl transferase component Bud32/tetratricopeptide (TPR) repeat protein
MPSDWYYSRDGEQHGPLSSADLVRLAKAGELLPTDFLWKDGMSDWRPASDFPKLFAAGQADSQANDASSLSAKPQAPLDGGPAVAEPPSAVSAASAGSDSPSPDPSSLKGLTMALGIEPAKPGQDSLLGCDIGGVTIVRLIAEGGMGRVYEGKQEKPNRTVAVKVMRPGLTSPSILKRFEYEAEVLGRLQHPGIGHIYSVSVHRMGNATVPYFVMEYIADARSLTQYADDLKLPTRQRLDLFRSVCDAVAHGHQKGVIHRDLKPSNILVDATGQPKVIDFGVARATDSDMALTTMQTDVGQLIGTLQYMSPEQFDADPNDIDIRSDVYALGVILYELLAGKMPYDVKKKAIYEVMRIVKEEEPTPLSSFNRALKGDVAVIAGKCLEKERNRRYSSASELGSDVGRYLSGDPIAASPPGFVDGLVRLAKKHRVAATALAGVFASLVLAVVGIGLAASHAYRQKAAAEQALNFFSDTLQNSNPTLQGRPVSVVDLLRYAFVRVDRGTSLDREAKAGTLMVLARSFHGHGLYLDAASASQKAYDILANLRGSGDPLTLEALCLLLEAELNRPESQSSVALGEQLLAARTARFGPSHDATIEALSNLAVAYRKADMLENAIPAAERALALRLSAAGPAARDTLLAMNNLAVSLRRAGRTDEATVIYRDLIQKAEGSLGLDDSDTLQFVYNFAVANYKDQNLEAAERLFRRVYDARARTLGDVHPETIDSLNALSRVLLRIDNSTEARKLLSPFGSGRLKTSHPHLGALIKQLFAADEHLKEAFVAMQRADSRAAYKAIEAAAKCSNGREADERIARWKALSREAKTMWDTLHSGSKVPGEFMRGPSTCSLVEVAGEVAVLRQSGRFERVPVLELPFSFATAWLALDREGQGAKGISISTAIFLLLKVSPDLNEARRLLEACNVLESEYRTSLALLCEDHVITTLAASRRPQGPYQIAGNTATGMSSETVGVEPTPLLLKALEKPLTVKTPRKTLQGMLTMISEQAQVPIDIVRADLQGEGITANQAFGLEADGRPARLVLAEVLTKADRMGRLVWIVSDEGGHETVLVTTRAAVKRRGDRLPREFSDGTSDSIGK